ncbi:MAG: glycerol kinase GlpK [Pseudomonadales bacterium]
MTHLLAIDQGTTSSRAIVFNEAGEALHTAQQEFRQIFPEDGWVEHDAEEIWATTVQVIKAALAKAKLAPADIAGVGITNQRETTILWDKHTGAPIHNAIVWQDRRTADFCRELADEGLEPWFNARTGLLLDPYFSATKVKWLLDHVEGARAKADAGELLFGTVDCFLLWRLTRGQAHKTDATNASRTMLFNIHEQTWDKDILERLNIPASLLPQVEDCSADFGQVDAGLFGGSMPVYGIAGDQQAALIGQGCFAPGMTKSTYGTGCFVIMNTGAEAVASGHKLLTTVGYRLDGEVTYGLEGSIFIAGAAVQWLRDGLKLIQHAAETQHIAENHPLSHGVYLVPAFTGLGAPYWDPNARGAIFGLTRDTGINDLVVATLESVCFQTKDLLSAMQQDGAVPTMLRIDGGMVANDWFSQHLADILQVQVDRPRVIETTALGVAYLAGLKAGVYSDKNAIADAWQLERSFKPQMLPEDSLSRYQGWQASVAKVRTS